LTHAARNLAVCGLSTSTGRPASVLGSIRAGSFSEMPASRVAVTDSIVKPISLARQQPMGIDPRDVDQFQHNLSRRCDPRLVFEPGLKPDLQRIGEELRAVFPAQVFANLSETFGELRRLLTIRVVPGHAVSSEFTS
jgi:hypothetical protein